MLAARATVVLLIKLAVFSQLGSADDAVACTVYRQPGNITLGALLSLHGSTSDYCDTDIITRGVVHAEAMAWAVRDINSRNDILPNISLGFDIRDDCRDEDVALWMSLTMLENISPEAFQDTCLDLALNRTSPSPDDSKPAVIGIIGTSRSATSIPVAQLSGLFQIPIMSFWASSNELSDKSRFPYFLRTVPPDRHQISAIMDLLERFRWNYIALIHSVDSYGLHGARELLVLAEQRDICIAFTSPVNQQPTEKELKEVVAKLEKYEHARVVVMFAALQVANAVLDRVNSSAPDLNITWIGGDDWGFDLSDRGLGNIAQGSLFTRFFSKTVPPFESHFASLNSSTDSVSPWFVEYTTRRREKLACANDTVPCPGIFPDNPSSNFVVSPVIDGVYAFAYALDSLLTEFCPGQVINCLASTTITGERLRSHLLKVNFTGTGGLLFFDENADPPGKYILKNYQKTGNGNFASLEIGLWDSQNTTTRLQLRDDLIRWKGGSTEVPRSTCIPDCEPGYILVPSEENCCLLCQSCRDNEITVNGSDCMACDPTTWPDTNRTSCEDIIPSSLSFRDPIVITILLFSIIGLLLTALTAGGFTYHRSTPLIKAASRELSGIVLVGVVLAFLAVFLLLTQPTLWTCLASGATISLSFTLTYAPTLLKVNRIYRIFKASRVSVRRPKWVSPRKLVTLATILVVTQILIIVVSSTVSPAQAQLMLPLIPVNYLELYCSFGYGFLAPCAYNLALILACCFYAFKTRRVPDNYNESKFIAVSVYSTLVVCLATLPVYLTAVEVIQKVATLCSAVLLNSYLTLACVYLPKLYAVRFVSQQNQDVQNAGVAATAAGTVSQAVALTGSVGQVRPL